MLMFIYIDPILFANYYPYYLLTLFSLSILYATIILHILFGFIECKLFTNYIC